jgi:uncharacterized coiled-coil protein SlyX
MLTEKTEEMNKLMEKVQTSEVRRQEKIMRFPFLASCKDHQLNALRAQVERQQVVIDKIANRLKDCNESVTRYEKLVKSSYDSSTLGSTCADK